MQISSNYSMNGVPYENRRRQKDIPQFSTERAKQENKSINPYMEDTDFNKKAFDMIGPNAPQEVKDALILPVACMARDFDGFRADVPPGWEVMEEKGAMVGFVSPDREAIVTVTVASAQDVDPAAFAAEMAQGLGGAISWKKMVSTASHSGIMV